MAGAGSDHRLRVREDPEQHVCTFVDQGSGGFRAFLELLEVETGGEHALASNQEHRPGFIQRTVQTIVDGIDEVVFRSDYFESSGYVYLAVWNGLVNLPRQSATLSTRKLGPVSQCVNRFESPGCTPLEAWSAGFRSVGT